MKLRSPLIPLMSIFCLSLSALGCEESSSEKGSDEETTLSRDVSSAEADDDAADADDADDADADADDADADADADAAADADADASDDSAQALLALAEALGAEQEGESEELAALTALQAAQADELAALKDLASTLAASQEPDSECSAGEYGADCEPCPAGLWCQASGAIVACASGQYCPEGTTTPEVCAAGSYCATPSTTPIACAAGEYCAAGSSAPIECVVGEYCAAGSSAPVACSAGTWDADADASTPCEAWSECPVGQEETVAPSSREDRVCVDFSWTKQFGTVSGDFVYPFDYAESVATDASGNVYVSGRTLGSLEGSNQGGSDAYVRKLNAAGEEVWTKQFGTTSDDYANSVATDASGNVYVSGYTGGSLEGSTQGGVDAYVRKLNSAGEEQWTKQFGTVSSDRAYSVTTDASGNVYVSGYTFGSLDGSNLGSSDAYVRKLNAAGEEQWTKQFGTVSSDYSESVATDASGNVYVGGFTQGSLDGSNQGSFDAYVRKLNSAGEEVWTKQFGTVGNDYANSFDYAESVATDASGNVYVSGYTNGSLKEGSTQGRNDAYVMKLNAAGEGQWTKQFGTTSDDIANSVTTDASGNVYVSGYTFGDLEGSTQGSNDAYVMKLNAAGEEQWTKQFGTVSSDYSESVATDASGNVYVSGSTFGDLYGDNAGGSDIFVRRIVPDDIY